MKSLKVVSTEDIRSQFPALNRRSKDNFVAYFDGPGGTQVPRAVVEAMTDYLLNHNANTHWAFQTSKETDQIIASARQTIADFLNARDSEIIFGQNMTTLTLHLARTLARNWQAGDEVIVTELDHHANIDTWRSLEIERGIIVRHLPFNLEDGQLQLEELPGFFRPNTKLLAIGAASNALGTISDVAEACRIAKSADVLSFVDAVHYAPHNLLDVQAINCDFLACSAYKFYGPHLGILFARKDLLVALEFPKLRPAPDAPPEKAETGTQNHEAIAGTAAAVNFLASLAEPGNFRERLAASFSILHERQKQLVRILWDGLHSIPGIRVYGPAPEQPRTSTISFTVQGHHSEEVAEFLSERGIFVSNGDFYAATVVEKYGLTDMGGFIRAGCSCYTTTDEVERLILGIEEFVQQH